MSKFIKKLFLFVFIITSAVIVVNILYIHKNINDGYGTRKFQEVPSGIQICNLGSSHGMYGFYYNDFPDYVCFNFALSSQRFSYDYRILYNYQDKIGPDAIVFIPISYFSFWGDETKSEDFQAMNKRYYTFLPADLIKCYDIATDLYVRYFPSLTAKWELPKALLGKQQKKEAVINQAVDIDIEEDARKAYNRHIKLNEDEEGKRVINQDELDALYKIIDLCREIEAEPVLVTTPYLSEYTGIIEDDSPDFYRIFYGVVQQVVDEKEVLYYDYAKDERFCEDYSLFMNADHLNADGAKKFTAVLVNEIVAEKKF